MYNKDKHAQAEHTENRNTNGRAATDSLVEESQMATG